MTASEKRKAYVVSKNTKDAIVKREAAKAPKPEPKPKAAPKKVDADE